MAVTVEELARRLGAPFEGDGAQVIRGVSGLREAAPGEIAFVGSPRYAPDAATTAASAVIVGRDWNRSCAAPAVIRVENPEEAFSRVVAWFAPPPAPVSPGIHPAAIVSPGARLGEAVSVGPGAVVEAGASIGDRTILSAGVYVGHGVRIGSDCRLYPHVSVREHVVIGDRAIIHNGAVIGSDGFGYTADTQGVWHKIPQIGTVVVGDDVEIGANVTVDRARFGRTRIGNGVKIDNLVQIAHNVILGDHAILAAQVGIAGSSHVGSRVMMGGQAGVAGHLSIGEGAIVGGQAGVTKDVPPGTFVTGYPAAPHEKAARAHAGLMRLPQLKERLAELETRLRKLEEKLDAPPERP